MIANKNGQVKYQKKKPVCNLRIEELNLTEFEYKNSA